MKDLYAEYTIPKVLKEKPGSHSIKDEQKTWQALQSRGNSNGHSEYFKNHKTSFVIGEFQIKTKM